MLGLRANTGLDSFVCTPSEIKTFVDVLPTLSSIGYLKANVQLLKEEDHPSLLQVRGLRSVTLEFASWQLIHALPTWAADTLGPTLKNLTFYVSVLIASLDTELISLSELFRTDGGDNPGHHHASS